LAPRDMAELADAVEPAPLIVGQLTLGDAVRTGGHVIDRCHRIPPAVPISGSVNTADARDSVDAFDARDIAAVETVDAVDAFDVLDDVYAVDALDSVDAVDAVDALDPVDAVDVVDARVAIAVIAWLRRPAHRRGRRTTRCRCRSSAW